MHLQSEVKRRDELDVKLICDIVRREASTTGMRRDDTIQKRRQEYDGVNSYISETDLRHGKEADYQDHYTQDK
jgi:hypothetical protein